MVREKKHNMSLLEKKKETDRCYSEYVGENNLCYYAIRCKRKINLAISTQKLSQ